MRARVAIATHASALTEASTVVLPAATHYEQEGVYVSMNGRAQRLRPGAEPPAGAAPGWELLIALAHRLGAPPPYRTAARAFAAAAAARPALAGLDYEALGVLGRRAARAAGAGLGQRRLGPARGRRRRPAAGRHGAAARQRVRATARTRSRRSAPAPSCVLHPEEGRRHGLADGGRARLRTPHGECAVPVRLDAAHPEGAAFVAAGVPGRVTALPPTAAPCGSRSPCLVPRLGSHIAIRLAANHRGCASSVARIAQLCELPASLPRGIFAAGSSITPEAGH